MKFPVYKKYIMKFPVYKITKGFKGNLPIRHRIIPERISNHYITVCLLHNYSFISPLLYILKHLILIFMLIRLIFPKKKSI